MIFLTAETRSSADQDLNARIVSAKPLKRRPDGVEFIFNDEGDYIIRIGLVQKRSEDDILRIRNTFYGTQNLNERSGKGMWRVGAGVTSQNEF